MTAAKIKVMVADDSEVMRTLLVKLFNDAPGMEVVGTVADGQAAVEYLANGGGRPDVLLMDIHMPRLDGFEATRRIMETHPLPIVICTATADPRELATAFRSIEVGAVACVQKPVALGADFDSRRDNLLQTVRLMSEVKVVRRWKRTRPAAAAPAERVTELSPLSNGGFRLVGIGASTGGPPVLQTILRGLPKDFSVPIVIVQHIAHCRVMPTWRPTTASLRSIGAARCYCRRPRSRTACARPSRTCSARSRTNMGPAPSACCSPAWARTARPS
jgi:two-component system chemotaxis response regulator CheB